MRKAALVVLVIGALVLVGLADGDGRLAAGDLVAHAFGYVLRVELTLERQGAPVAATAAGVPDRLCTLPADTAIRVVVRP